MSLPSWDLRGESLFDLLRQGKRDHRRKLKKRHRTVSKPKKEEEPEIKSKPIIRTSGKKLEYDFSYLKRKTSRKVNLKFEPYSSKTDFNFPK